MSVSPRTSATLALLGVLTVARAGPTLDAIKKRGHVVSASECVGQLRPCADLGTAAPACFAKTVPTA